MLKAQSGSHEERHASADCGSDRPIYVLSVISYMLLDFSTYPDRKQVETHKIMVAFPSSH